MFAVINASHTFYTGTTSVPIDKNNPTSRKRKTSALNTTSNPEDKRKIIGDTFMKVRQIRTTLNFLSFSCSFKLFESHLGGGGGGGGIKGLSADTAGGGRGSKDTR